MIGREREGLLRAAESHALGFKRLVETGSLGPAVPLVQGSLTPWVAGFGQDRQGPGAAVQAGWNTQRRQHRAAWKLGDKASQAGGSRGETGDQGEALRTCRLLWWQEVALGAQCWESQRPRPHPQGGQRAAERGHRGVRTRLNAGAAEGRMATSEAPGLPAPPPPHIRAGH